MLTVKEEVAKNLLYYRKKNNLTQKNLADSLGVKHNSISSWESGTNSIDIDTLFKICEILNVQVSDMFGVYSHGQPEHFFMPHEREHLMKYRMLDEHGKEVVSNLLDKEYERICQKKKVATYQIKPNFSTADNTDEEIEVEELEDIRLFNQPSSAGLGSMIDSDDYELIRIPTSKIPRGAEFCVKITGNSMEPTISDGDIVFIKPTPQLENNEIGIFFQDGEMFCKRLCIDYDRKRAYLTSDNSEYKPMKVSEDCFTIGKVLLPKR